MKIQAREELKDLIPKVESELEKALQERKDLGLSVPQNFDTQIKFYNIQGLCAYAKPTKPIPTLAINVAPLLMNKLGAEDKEKTCRIMHYFDTMRDFFGGLDEEAVFFTINDPQETFKNFEECFTEGQLTARENFFKERGVSCEVYKRFAIGNADYMRRGLEDLLPKIKNAFTEESLSCLRHEVDHIDFFDTQLYSMYLLKIKEFSELGERAKLDSSLLKEYSRLNMEHLEFQSIIDPLLEVRAWFFDFVKPDEWKNADFLDIKKEISNIFISEYVNRTYAENILNKLVSVKWTEEKMNRQTSNYLFKKINDRIGSSSAQRYVVIPSNVNYSVASRVLHEELPRWQNKFASNAKIAVQAIGNAYQHNPSKLREASKAKTFNEYIQLLQA